MYCCAGMEGFINDVECDGISVMVRPGEQKVVFRLQFKSISDTNDTKKIMRYIHSLPALFENFKIQCAMVINYCPTCGTNLQRLYEENKEFYDEIAQLHESRGYFKDMF